MNTSTIKPKYKTGDILVLEIETRYKKGIDIIKIVEIDREHDIQYRYTMLVNNSKQLSSNRQHFYDPISTFDDFSNYPDDYPIKSVRLANNTEKLLYS